MGSGTRQYISTIDTWSEGDALKEKKKICLLCGLNYAALNELSQFYDLYCRVWQASGFLRRVCAILHICTVQSAYLPRLF